MSRLLVPGLVLLTVSFLCLFGGTGCQQTPPAPDDLGPVGNFSLTERSKKTITNKDLQGKVWIASFVFTRCTGPCPQVTATMARLQSELAQQPDLRLVTFTVDPERDDPDELSRYANHFQADPERWLFLTGTPEEMDHLVNKGFHVYAKQNTGEDRKPGAEVAHQTRLVVVDKRGNIRGYFDGLRDSRSQDPERDFEENLKRLRQTVTALVREAP